MHMTTISRVPQDEMMEVITTAITTVIKQSKIIIVKHKVQIGSSHIRKAYMNLMWEILV